jgi:hypothetical protein
MLHKGIYNLKSIWEIQTEALLSNFTNRINDIGKTGQTTKIRLKDAQILNWEPTNIVKKRIPHFFNTRDNFQIKVLMLAHDHNIIYQGNALHNIFEWQGGAHPIKETLKNDKIYRKSTKQLSNLNLMFLDQIIDNNSNTIIDWQIYKSLIDINNKGRTPVWYNLIKNRITTGEDNKINNRYSNKNFINNNYKWTNDISPDNRIRDWVAILNKCQEITLGKTIEKGNKDKQLKKIIISHHINKEILKGSFKLTPCTGCNLNDLSLDSNRLGSPCSFKINRKEVKGIKYLNSKKSKNNIIPCNQKVFEDIIKNELNNAQRSSNPYIPRNHQSTIHITSLGLSLIHKWIKSETYRDDLTKAYCNN